VKRFNSKATLLSILLVSTVIIFSYRPNSAADDSSLIAHWTFDEIITGYFIDISKNNYNGQLHGDIKLEKGLKENAAVFDGSTNYISIPYDITNPDHFPDGEISISALVKVKNILEPNMLCYGCGPVGYFSFGSSTTFTNRAIVNISAENGLGQYCFSGYDLFPERWTQIIFTLKKNGLYKYYVDCNLSSVNKKENLALKAKSNPTIGKFVENKGSTTVEHYLNGSIDDLKIWNKALTEEEIAEECKNIDLCGDNVCSGSESFMSCPSDCGYASPTGESGTYIDFGSTDDLTKGSVIIKNQENYSGIQTDADTTYRNILKSKSSEIWFPVFNNDKDGFPNSSMVVEIRYKDLYSFPKESTHTAKKASLTSMIQFDGKDVVVFGFEGKGDSKWKLGRILFRKTPWQMIRAIGGYYKFKIIVPSEVGDLPIDYILIHSVSDSDTKMLEQLQKDQFAFRQIEAPKGETNDFPISKLPIWFTKSPTEPVFTTTLPSPDEINSPVHIDIAKAETSSTSLSIYSPTTLNNVKLKVSPLILSHDENNTFDGKIDIYKIIQDDKMWLQKGMGSAYGRMPDRIERFYKTEINKDVSESFWLTVSAGSSTRPGLYNGTINITASGEKILEIPLELEVARFSLLGPGYITTLYVHPETFPVTTNYAVMFKDISNHGADVKYPSVTKNTVTTIQVNDTIHGYNYDKFVSLLDEAIKGHVVGKTHFLQIQMHDELLSKLEISKDDLFVALYDEKFVKAFELLIKGLNKIAVDRGITFVYSVTDEPGVDVVGHLVADRLYPLVRATGGKTWVTYTPDCEKEINYTTPAVTHLLRPLGQFLDYKMYAWSKINDSNISTDKEKFGFYTTFLSQARNPIYNRFLHGIYAYITGAKVIGVYSYDWWVNDPYSDFDQDWTQNGPLTVYDYLLAYPTWSGEMIPTMAYEGMREGITDAKYFNTLSTLIKQYPDTESAKNAKKYLEERFTKISVDLQTDYWNKKNDYGFAHLILDEVNAGYENLGYSAFDEIRDRVRSFILAILHEANITDLPDDGAGESDLPNESADKHEMPDSETPPPPSELTNTPQLTDQILPLSPTGIEPGNETTLLVTPNEPKQQGSSGCSLIIRD